MKSAYELAMERLQKDGPVKTLTDDQKAALAELDSRFRAKIAEREVFLQGEITKARATGDLTALEQLEDQMRREIRRLEADRDDAKDKVRAGS